MGLISAKQRVFGGRMCAVTNGHVQSHELSTDDGESDDPLGRGRAFFHDGVTVGVVCDLETNSLRFYIDDKIVRKSGNFFLDLESADQSDRLIDSNLLNGEPFVWRDSNPEALLLCDSYPYVAVFDCPATLEFIDWSPPPLLPS